MLRRRLLICIVLLFVLNNVFSHFFQNAAYGDEIKPMQPMLNHILLPELRLWHCEGYEDYPDWQNKVYSVPEKVKKNFKSKKWTRVEEIWYGDFKLRTYRWYFEYPGDPSLFIETGALGFNQAFPGWSDKSEIGEKSCWWGYMDFFFIKGNVLARVQIICSTILITEEQQKAYVRRVAEYVAKKL